MDDDIVFNGIDATTGGYLTAATTPQALARMAMGLPPLERDLQRDLERFEERALESFGIVASVDHPDRVEEAGWCVAFGPGVDEASARDALKPLLTLRKAQAGRFYREARIDAGETKASFLEKFGTTGGQPADPDLLGYYILIVGSPEGVPYRLQYALDVEYGVGRLWFEQPEGTPDWPAFRRYAESVVAAESATVRLARRAAFFGTAHPGDRATTLSSRELVGPLAAALAPAFSDWEFGVTVGNDATKSKLGALMASSPALLFTASHGIGLPNGHDRQLAHQGALLCQDWPAGRPATPEHYYSGDDADAGPSPFGAIAVHFACYGVGTPHLNDFPHVQDLTPPGPIAPRPFVARLPQRLLGHEEGGALAVIGHVERAWGCSFVAQGVGRQLQTFQSLLHQILEGKPAGLASEYLNGRFAALSTELADMFQDIKSNGRVPNERKIAAMFTESNDARGFAVLGDPAAKLSLAARPEDAARPTLPPVDLGVEPEAPQSPAAPSPPPAPVPPGPSPLLVEPTPIRPGREAEVPAVGDFGVEAGGGVRYHLIAYDERGRERTEPNGRLASWSALGELAAEPVTDVIVFSHGWMGDVPAARAQYDLWTATMVGQPRDMERARAMRPGFRPLLIGIHWPSKPWGDSRLGAPASFAAGVLPAPAATLSEWTQILGDAPQIRSPLRVLLEAGADPAVQLRGLSDAVRDAYLALDWALGLGAGGQSPGSDREPFEPEAAYEAALAGPSDEAGTSFGLLPSADALLDPLRALSFWKMKDRARLIGEAAVHPLLKAIQSAAAGRDVRVHLMGHSFGSIVCCAATAGPPGSDGLMRPIDSLSLVQGALSLWSCSASLPSDPQTAGYFAKALGKVRGPIITTQSEHDRAVGWFYPLGARVARQVAFDSGLPRYGAVGTYGLRGLATSEIAQEMLPTDRAYAFQNGRVHNLESSRYIVGGGGLAGAHSEFSKPEVAHAVWSAMLAAV